MKLAITMLAAVFAYSCTTYTSGGPAYYAKIAKADSNYPYTSVYPDVIEEPEGYFLNDNARYGSYEYGEYICISRVGGRDSTIANCVKNDELGSFDGESTEEMKKWLKSANTPYNDAINKEIFGKWNFDFLGFYSVDGQLYYIYVYFMPGE